MQSRVGVGFLVAFIAATAVGMRASSPEASPCQDVVPASVSPQVPTQRATSPEGSRGRDRLGSPLPPASAPGTVAADPRPATPIQDIDRNQDPALFSQLFGERLATRPSDPDGPTVVYYGIEIEEVRAIEAAARRYYVRGFLWTYWRDPRAAIDVSQLIGEEADRRDAPSIKWDAKAIRDRNLVWNPEFDFKNADRDLQITSETVEVFPAKPGHNEQPEVEYWCKFSGWFSDQDGSLDFHDFPFDKQALYIDLTTAYGVKQVVFRRCWELDEEDMRRLSTRLTHPEWEFESVDIGVREGSYVSEGNRQFSIGRTIAVARRKPAFYALNLGLPIAIILVLFNCLLWIKSSEFEAKLGGIITCLLSLVAFSLVVNAEVPKIPYMTVFGRSLILCFIIITLGATFTVLEHLLQSRAPGPTRIGRGGILRSAGRMADRWGAIGLNCMSTAVIAYFLLHWWLSPSVS